MVTARPFIPVWGDTPHDVTNNLVVLLINSLRSSGIVTAAAVVDTHHTSPIKQKVIMREDVEGKSQRASKIMGSEANNERATSRRNHV